MVGALQQKLILDRVSRQREKTIEDVVFFPNK